MQQKERGEQQRTEFVQPPQRAEQIETVGERFRKLSPPIVEDALDPTTADDWLRTLENMFRYSRVSEVEKVVCAFFMLRGSAEHWLEMMSSIEDVNAMTWDRFKEFFRNRPWDVILTNGREGISCRTSQAKN
ncbi:unnamed protein product [Fraxinus pennsylvanica]|uniref:Retrotransposon gag domain-containing protein n=1 Tax=Fraxinus pennsylvanica TaxID=56036 RepID=A0AAD1ZKQ3_9LAMI|nr:unnamed protein product [Fraxinus pennsylvanica]